MGPYLAGIFALHSQLIRNIFFKHVNEICHYNLVSALMSRQRACTVRQHLVCIGAGFQLIGGVSHSCISLSLPAVQPANDQVLQQGGKKRGKKGIMD